MWDEQFEQILRPYLHFLSPSEPLGGDMRLWEYGLDSLGMVELLTRLEGAYDIRFADDALNRETFETPDVLWKTVQGAR